MIQIAIHAEFGIIFEYIDGTLDGLKFHALMQYKILPKMRPKCNLNKTGLVIDGAPPHHTRKNMSYLDRLFEGKIIGRDQKTWNGRGIDWPAHSYDCHPNDFYFNGRMKDLLMQDGLPETIPELKSKFEKVVEAWDLKELKRGIFGMEKRVKLMVKAAGGHFEKFMQ